eukprot:19357-Prorocentrum_minimum.AAC.3
MQHAQVMLEPEPNFGHVRAPEGPAQRRLQRRQPPPLLQRRHRRQIHHEHHLPSCCHYPASCCHYPASCHPTSYRQLEHRRLPAPRVPLHVHTDSTAPVGREGVQRGLQVHQTPKPVHHPHLLQGHCQLEVPRRSGLLPLPLRTRGAASPRDRRQPVRGGHDRWQVRRARVVQGVWGVEVHPLGEACRQQLVFFPHQLDPPPRRFRVPPEGHLAGRWQFKRCRRFSSASALVVNQLKG